MDQEFLTHPYKMRDLSRPNTPDEPQNTARSAALGGLTLHESSLTPTLSPLRTLRRERETG